MHNLTEASSSYERCLVYEALPTDLNRVYTRMALVYLKQKKVLNFGLKFFFFFI